VGTAPGWAGMVVLQEGEARALLTHRAPSSSVVAVSRQRARQIVQRLQPHELETIVSSFISIAGTKVPPGCSRLGLYGLQTYCELPAASRCDLLADGRLALISDPEHPERCTVEVLLDGLVLATTHADKFVPSYSSKPRETFFDRSLPLRSGCLLTVRPHRAALQPSFAREAWLECGSP
jgi:hypothetical protein